MRLTIVFEDHRVSGHYANGVSRQCDFYTNHGDHFEGNTQTKQVFTSAVENAGHNMDDYWAIQYSGGQMEIEYANGHPNQVLVSNTGLSNYTAILDEWEPIFVAEEAERQRLLDIPTWDDILWKRGDLLLISDGIVSWATEFDQSIPQEWADYRQELRDIPETFNYPTGNTELVVWPSVPDWPSSNT